MVRFAFEWALATAARKVTASHKANIMKFSDGLFLEVARRVAARYPGIAFDDRIIDALCMQLIQAPERFDVLVMAEPLRRRRRGARGGTRAAGWAWRRAPTSAGRSGRELAVFEATHGTAHDLAGTNQADPFGVIVSAAR